MKLDWAWLVTASLVATGCIERPSAGIICHNSNCRAPTDPFLDDTMQALRQSLDMTWNGAPLLDGVELDTVWDREAERCVFAHDVRSAIGGAEAMEATEEVSDHLRETATTVGERRFYVKIEQKPVVAPDGTEATTADRIAHAECSLDMFEHLSAAAAETGRNLTVWFESTDVHRIEAITEHARYPGKLEGESVQTGLMFPVTATPPDGLQVDVASINWKDFRKGDQREIQDLRSRGIQIMLWMNDASIDVLGVVGHVAPDFVTTSEAALLREWMAAPAP